MVSDASGDVRRDPRVPNGLFYRDMRHLSRWEIRLDGRRPEAISGTALECDEAVFFLAERIGSMEQTPTYSIVRRRHVSGGVYERLQLTNYGVDPLLVHLSVLFSADFADVFEIDDDVRKAGSLYRRVDGERATLGYERDDFRRETEIYAPGAFVTGRVLTYPLLLEPGQEWETEIEISVVDGALRVQAGRTPPGTN